jgi:hypothetical protein
MTFLIEEFMKLCKNILKKLFNKKLIKEIKEKKYENKNTINKLNKIK